MANTKTSGWGKWILIALLAGAGYGGWRWYSQKEKQAPVEYKSEALTTGDLIQQVSANGSLNPVRHVEVGSQISGTITDIKVDFNSKVKSGDLIAQIDPATYERALRQAEAELANSEAAKELALLDYTRADELFNAKLIAKSEYDKARVDLRQAEATVLTRQANVDRAKVDLSRTTIFAPMDGIVISRNVDIGQTVAASFNTPTLFMIANDLAKMQIDAMVSEADVGGVEEGQPVNFIVDAYLGRKFKGKVRQVRFAPITNQNVVNYTTVVEVNNDDLKLRPGMTANANIIVSEKKGVLRIPNSALRFRPPPTATIVGATNATAAAKGAGEIATSGPFAGLPIPPWQAGGERRRPTDEERATYEAALTAEQKQKYDKAVADMRARFAQREGGGGGPGGGGPGGGGGDRPRRTEPEGPRSQTVYLLDKSADPSSKGVAKAVTVKVGTTDGTYTEVIDGLKAGDVVITGTVTSATGTAAAPNPFGGPFGGGGGVRR